jgi:hypothetical protein
MFVCPLRSVPYYLLDLRYTEPGSCGKTDCTAYQWAADARSGSLPETQLDQSLQVVMDMLTDAGAAGAGSAMEQDGFDENFDGQHCLFYVWIFQQLAPEFCDFQSDFQDSFNKT